ncbi:histidine N-alpha-methyltransferase-like [Pecten maximus]|uniref:histidine N-alpha-methyltransferase-like n=1 Tax=Pecten maximus TaxID=6579 RepID=UPI001458B640|nr:histidine N-alpha-methyltransferase-like [Pecten maximus]
MWKQSPYAFYFSAILYGRMVCALELRRTYWTFVIPPVTGISRIQTQVIGEQDLRETMTDTVEQRLIKGLKSFPKYIPAWYKYDTLGSELELECRDTAKNTDYYLYRCMTSCLQSNIQEIVPNKKTSYKLVDLGSGNCSKTRHVIDQLLLTQKQLAFYPVDISKDFLMRTVDNLYEEYGRRLVIYPTTENYMNGIEKLRHLEGPKVILWFNAILNLTYRDQVEILRQISTIMTGDCHLIFSTDITQDETSILKAYDDKKGKYARLYISKVILQSSDPKTVSKSHSLSHHYSYVTKRDAQGPCLAQLHV